MPVAAEVLNTLSISNLYQKYCIYIEVKRSKDFIIKFYVEYHTKHTTLRICHNILQGKLPLFIQYYIFQRKNTVNKLNPTESPLKQA